MEGSQDSIKMYTFFLRHLNYIPKDVRNVHFPKRGQAEECGRSSIFCNYIRKGVRITLKSGEVQGHTTYPSVRNASVIFFERKEKRGDKSVPDAGLLNVHL